MLRTTLGLALLALGLLTGSLSAQDNLRRGMRATDYVNGRFYSAYEDHPDFHRQAYGNWNGGNNWNGGHHHHGGNWNGGWNNWRGGGIYGFGVSRPWFGGNSLSVSFGYPYSSFSYFNGPWYGNYYGYQRPTFFGSNVSIFNPVPYGAYYSPSANYIDYFLPPTYFPAEVAYGPQAMKQFMGLDRNFALGPLRNPEPIIVAKPNVDVQVQPVVKEIDWEGRAKADKFIVQGDEFFQKQKFNDALLRYRMAANAAKDYPEAFLRHGFSLIACKRYDEAATALKKAFALDPQIVKSGFRIDQLYADNRMVREAHEEALAQAALDNPTDGDLMFDVGMWLLFNGEVERSTKFFEKAKELGVAAVD